jgi:hypothetical protein
MDNSIQYKSNVIGPQENGPKEIKVESIKPNAMRAMPGFNRKESGV